MYFPFVSNEYSQGYANSIQGKSLAPAWPLLEWIRITRFLYANKNRKNANKKNNGEGTHQTETTATNS